MNDRDFFPRFYDTEGKVMLYWQCYMQSAFNRLTDTQHFGLLYNLLRNPNIIKMRCTGLKDKNGKLIYEEDIVKITDKSSRKEPFIGIVEYTNTASFEANCNGFYMHLHNPKTPENISKVEKMFCTSLREIEVIGNIRENPELLESEER